MGNVRHFAINADDLPRARRFYESVFAWRFQPWGPPGFFMIAPGRRILMEKATIPGVGDLIFFEAPDGNIAGAMRCDARAE